MSVCFLSLAATGMAAFFLIYGPERDAITQVVRAAAVLLLAITSTMTIVAAYRDRARAVRAFFRSRMMLAALVSGYAGLLLMLVGLR